MQYAASDWGRTFHALTVDEALGAGSAGPGKSMILLMDPIQQVQLEHMRCLREFPDGMDRKLVDYLYNHPIRWGMSLGWAIHLRREFAMLDQTLARATRIFKNIDPDAHFDKGTSTWHFKSGYRYQFGHCKDRDDWEKYQSSEYCHIGYDELVQFTQEQYMQINTRLRSSDPVMRQMLKIRAMSNPYFKREVGSNIAQDNPHWVRDYFVKPCREGKKIIRRKVVRPDGTHFHKTRIYLPATLYDNPDKGFVKQYEMQLADKPAHIRNALLYGDWWVTPGSFYGEDWLSHLHVVRPFDIPRDWPRFRSMDWGFKTHGVVHWWAMDYDGNMYCEREFTFKEMLDVAVAKRIREIEKREGLWKDGRSRLTGPADTQIWEQRGDSGKTKAEAMNELGVGWVPANKKSRADNAHHFLKRLKDHRGGTQLPGIMFFENCTQAIQTIPGIQADPNDIECPAKGGDDHWHDSVVYACSYVSRGADGVFVESDDDDGDDDDDERSSSSGKGRGWGYGIQY